MELVNNCLEQTLEKMAKDNPGGFPFDHGRRCYFDRYESLRKELNTKYHCNVAAGSSSIDGGLLTDHGPDHIKTVINRASQLLSGNGENVLTPYEIYLLLNAIHFHDMANILGRDKHEQNIDVMMKAVDSHLGDDVERRHIRDIARVHGGKILDDKDTISYLRTVEQINGCDVRVQAIAAILRFSDELADDKYRANNILLALNLIPKESEIYHKYASCLHSVMIRPSEQSIELHFSINVNDFTKKFHKKNPKSGRIIGLYILDEIFDRTLKTHLEAVYCNRYMGAIVDIKTIIVKIESVKSGQQIGEEMPSEINYRLEEKGYPTSPSGGIHAIDKNLGDWNGGKKPVSGLVFASYIQKGGFNDKSI